MENFKENLELFRDGFGDLAKASAELSKRTRNIIPGLGEVAIIHGEPRMDLAADENKRYDARQGLTDEKIIKQCMGGLAMFSALSAIDEVTGFGSSASDITYGLEAENLGRATLALDFMNTLEWNTNEIKNFTSGPFVKIAIRETDDYKIIPGALLGDGVRNPRVRLELSRSIVEAKNSIPHNLERRKLSIINAGYNFGTLENLKKYGHFVEPPVSIASMSTFYVRMLLPYFAIVQLHALERSSANTIDEPVACVVPVNRRKRCIVMPRTINNPTDDLQYIQNALNLGYAIFCHENISLLQAKLVWIACHPAPFNFVSYHPRTGNNCTRQRVWASLVPVASAIEGDLILISDSLYDLARDLNAEYTVEGYPDLATVRNWRHLPLEAARIKHEILLWSIAMHEATDVVLAFAITSILSCGKVATLAENDPARKKLLGKDFRDRRLVEKVMTIAEGGKAAKEKKADDQRQQVAEEEEADAALVNIVRLADEALQLAEASIESEVEFNEAVSKLPTNIYDVLSNEISRARDMSGISGLDLNTRIAFYRQTLLAWAHLLTAAASRSAVHMDNFLLSEHARNELINTATMTAEPSRRQIHVEARGIIGRRPGTHLKIAADEIDVDAISPDNAKKAPGTVSLPNTLDDNVFAEPPDNETLVADLIEEMAMQTFADRYGNNAYYAVNGFISYGDIVLPAERLKPPFLVNYAERYDDGTVAGHPLNDLQVLLGLDEWQLLNYSVTLNCMTANSVQMARRSSSLTLHGLCSHYPAPTFGAWFNYATIVKEAAGVLLEEVETFATPSTFCSSTAHMVNAFRLQFGFPMSEEFLYNILYYRGVHTSYIHPQIMLATGLLQDTEMWYGDEEALPYSQKLHIDCPLTLATDRLITSNFRYTGSEFVVNDIAERWGTLAYSADLTARMFCPQMNTTLALNMFVALLVLDTEVQVYTMPATRILRQATGLTRQQAFGTSDYVTARGEELPCCQAFAFPEFDALNARMVLYEVVLMPNAFATSFRLQAARMTFTTTGRTLGMRLLSLLADPAESKAITNNSQMSVCQLRSRGNASGKHVRSVQDNCDLAVSCEGMQLRLMRLLEITSLQLTDASTYTNAVLRDIIASAKRSGSTVDDDLVMDVVEMAAKAIKDLNIAQDYPLPKPRKE